MVINISGCLLIGVLTVLIEEAGAGQRLLRPFLGVGVLGGFTTFSTYIVDFQHALAAGAVLTGLAYLAGTLIAALIAVWAGSALTGRAVRARRARGAHRPRRGPRVRRGARL
jgi:CrcB protein